ncbi:MAG TPA: hypothetical protein DDZ81_15725 [Acetobacteraceae bacterium]|jgi:AsmA protein|nr:hypothetical protein [Acetobacteraceae bacterium]
MTPTRPLRIALIAVAAVIVIAAAAVAVAVARFDPNGYKPQIIQAVKRATGRDLALNGPLRLKPSLWPTIRASDVTFSNPPGFSRPQMASLQGLEVELSLIPLISGEVVIGRLVLIHPDILLETDAAGHANWRMTPEGATAEPLGAQTPVKSSGGTRTQFSIAAIRIEDGSLAYRDGQTGKTTTLAVAKLDAAAASSDAPLHVGMDAAYNGTAFNLTADTGSLTRLQDQAATTPWPLKATLAVGTAKLSADGSMAQPLRGKGYDLEVNGTVPDASTLTPLLQGYVPPPLRDVTFAAKVADKGGKLPEVSALTLHVGASDLTAQMPGLMLDHLNIAAATSAQPLQAEATGRFGDQPLAFAANTGPLAALLPDAKPAPFPVAASLKMAGATISAKGTVADIGAMTGANIAFAVDAPDLAALSVLARRPLPPVKQVTFQGVVTGDLHNNATLHGFSLTSADGNLAGDATIVLAGRNALTATLTSKRIDLDALQAAIDQAPPASAAPLAPGGKPSPAPKGDDHLFSRQPFPWAALRIADADITLTIADLHAGGADYKAINTHAVVKDGKLNVTPFAADLPGGHLTGTLSADAASTAPPIHVTLHAPGLALNAILAAAHQPAYATGNLEVFADLSGSGQSPHDIAASLDGSLGLAVAGGTIDTRLLGSLFGNVMNTLNTLNVVGKGGDSQLKCFGLRMQAQDGVGTIRPLALSSALLTMTGAGTVNLGDETVSMTLEPQARVGGTGVVIPLSVTGPIRNPAVKVNQLGAMDSNAAVLGIVGGLLGGDKPPGGGTADICTPALAAARGQAVPESAAKPAAKPAAPGTTKPEDILKNLFR